MEVPKRDPGRSPVESRAKPPDAEDTCYLLQYNGYNKCVISLSQILYYSESDHTLKKIRLRRKYMHPCPLAWLRQ